MLTRARAAAPPRVLRQLQRTLRVTAFMRNPEQNRESARRLAALRPSVALFSHGPSLRDPEAIKSFVATFQRLVSERREPAGTVTDRSITVQRGDS